MTHSHYTTYTEDAPDGIVIHVSFGLLQGETNDPVPTDIVTDLAQSVLGVLRTHDADLLTFVPYCMGTYLNRPEPTLAVTFQLAYGPRLTRVIADLLVLARAIHQDYLGIVGLSVGQTLLDVRTGELL